MNKRAFRLALYILYLTGAVGYCVAALRPIMYTLTPLVLFGTGFLVLLSLLDRKHLSLLWWCLLLYVVAFTLEAIGVKYGFIFGHYTYGKTLGVKLFDVPLVIGFNWVLVTLGGISMTRRLSPNKILLSLGAGILVMVFDFILEPVAMRLDFWSWANNEIPVQNYVAWFGIVLVSAYLFHHFKLSLRNRWPKHLFLAQALFFILLNVFKR